MNDNLPLIKPLNGDKCLSLLNYRLYLKWSICEESPLRHTYCARDVDFFFVVDQKSLQLPPVQVHTLKNPTQFMNEKKTNKKFDYKIIQNYSSMSLYLAIKYVKEFKSKLKTLPLVCTSHKSSSTFIL